jgi:beta-lactamase superfamily II metal-dependent hydrolase
MQIGVRPFPLNIGRPFRFTEQHRERFVFKRASRLVLLAGLAVLHLFRISAQAAPATQFANLRISVVDVDGGAAALFLTPEGKSLLIDTGWPPSRSGAGSAQASPAGSSTDRIVAAAASMGIKKIDYLLITHYHVDHIGGVGGLMEKLPVDAIIVHGPNREFITPDLSPQKIAISPERIYPGFAKAIQGHRQISVRAGQTVDIGSLELKFVTSDGAVISSPLPGAGQANPNCDTGKPLPETGGEENVRSLGMLMTFGKTRILDLGDLTWGKELELLCPKNKIGKVDVYFVTGHGMNLSSSPATAALDPLVAVMQNGPRKGGDEAVMNTIYTYPSLKGLWQSHFSTRYPTLNADPDQIANLDGQPDRAFPLELDITRDGQIQVTNSRNHFSKTYLARAAQK